MSAILAHPASCLLLLLVLLMPAVSPAQAPEAEQRARELVDLINARDLAAARSYLQEHYTPRFREAAPTVSHLSFLFEGRPNGVRLHEIQAVDSSQAVALLENELTGEWTRMRIQVAAEPPHRIDELGLELAEAPQRNGGRKLSDAELKQRLAAYVERLARADVFSGAVLLAHRGEPIYTAAYGDANKDFGVPNETDTKFNLGSMNKMMTAVAILQLVERGEVELDVPLSKYLPEFPSAEAAQKVQVKHLLSHTSGLGSYFNETFQQSARARYRTVDDFMRLAESDSLRFEPGTEWRYSNTGFLVLGKIIEVATGQSYFEYVQENIYEPAGMANTGAFELDRVNENLALGYQKVFTDEGVRYRNNLFDHVIKGGPAGGGYSTVGDLLRFARALRAGKLVGPQYVDMLLSPKPELNSPRYGYGFGIDTERQIAGHSGGFIGISSNLDLFLADGYTAVVLSNYGRASRPVVRKIRELVQASRETAAAR